MPYLRRTIRSPRWSARLETRSQCISDQGWALLPRQRQFRYFRVIKRLGLAANNLWRPVAHTGMTGRIGAMPPVRANGIISHTLRDPIRCNRTQSYVIAKLIHYQI
jgi:hypothetical protein